MAAACTAATSAAPKASRSAVARMASRAKAAPVLPAGEDESAEPDFSEAPAAKPARAKVATASATKQSAPVTTKPKAGKSKVPSEFVVTFDHKKETKGSHQFAEVGADGTFLDFNDAICGGFYVRKSHIIEGKTPKRVIVSVKVEY